MTAVFSFSDMNKSCLVENKQNRIFYCILAIDLFSKRANTWNNKNLFLYWIHTTLHFENKYWYIENRKTAVSA